MTDERDAGYEWPTIEDMASYAYWDGVTQNHQRYVAMDVLRVILREINGARTVVTQGNIIEGNYDFVAMERLRSRICVALG